MNFNLQTFLYMSGVESQEWPFKVRETTFITKDLQ